MDWDGLYLWAREWGIQPGHFWDMTLSEWWCEWEAKSPQRVGQYAGKLTQSDVDDLLDWVKKDAS
jgi:hypothetical protein